VVVVWWGVVIGGLSWPGLAPRFPGVGLPRLLLPLSLSLSLHAARRRGGARGEPAREERAAGAGVGKSVCVYVCGCVWMWPVGGCTMAPPPSSPACALPCHHTPRQIDGCNAGGEGEEPRPHVVVRP
jgi:hypothetical protein